MSELPSTSFVIAVEAKLVCGIFVVCIVSNVLNVT